MNDYRNPLWVRRLLLVVFSPLLLVVALWESISEAWTEFSFEMRMSWREVVDIWKGEK